MMLFLFWFIRICCVIGMAVNLVVVDVHNLPSLIFTIFGIIASVNIYGMGLLSHETYKSLPSLFILFRVIQLLLLLSTKCVAWYYLAIYAAIDVFVFALFVYDNKYQFILKLRGDASVKTVITRLDKKESPDESKVRVQLVKGTASGKRGKR